MFFFYLKCSKLHLAAMLHHRQRRHRVASLCCCVVEPLPCVIACLQSWQESSQCCYEAGQSSSTRTTRSTSPVQPSERPVTNQLDSEGHHILEPLSEPSYVAEYWQMTSSDRWWATACWYLCISETSVCGVVSIGISTSNIFSHKKVMSKCLQHITVRTSTRPGTEESWCSAEGRYCAISSLQKTWLTLSSWS